MEVSLILSLAAVFISIGSIGFIAWKFYSSLCEQINDLTEDKAILFTDNLRLESEISRLKQECKEESKKASLFYRVIMPAYKMLDEDKAILCESLKVSKEAYDKQMQLLSDESLEETLLTYRVHDILLREGYIYSKKFKNRFSSGQCEQCNNKIAKLVEELQDVTQSECKCNAEYAPPDQEEIKALNNQSEPAITRNPSN